MIPNAINSNLTRARTIAPMLGYRNAGGPFWRMVVRENVPRYAINRRVILFRIDEVESWLNARKLGGSL